MTADSVAIGAATAEEADRIVPAYEWLFAPPGMPPRDWDADRAAAALRRAVASERAVVLLAREGDDLVGLCVAYLDIESVRYGQRAWVEDLAVHPDRRSLGVGKRLLDAAKEWARTRGATHLELDSGEARAEAHRFYEREQPSWRSVCFAWEL